MQCMDRASLEGYLSQGLSLAEIGKRFGKHEATVSYWLKKHGLAAVNRDKHTAKGGLDQRDLEKLVDAGASIAEIAEKVGRADRPNPFWSVLSTGTSDTSWKAVATTGAVSVGLRQSFAAAARSRRRWWQRPVESAAYVAIAAALLH
jgi:hypothetical protein